MLKTTGIESTNLPAATVKLCRRSIWWRWRDKQRSPVNRSSRYWKTIQQVKSETKLAHFIWIKTSQLNFEDLTKVVSQPDRAQHGEYAFGIRPRFVLRPRKTPWNENVGKLDHVVIRDRLTIRQTKQSAKGVWEKRGLRRSKMKHKTWKWI